MRKRDAKAEPDAEAAAVGWAASLPATAQTGSLAEAADADADAAVRAKDAAVRALEQAQARLGDVRGELAVAERDRERRADQMAADPSPGNEAGFREACHLVETRSAILRAHGRLVDAARHDLDLLEAGLAQARQAVAAAELERRWGEVEERADAIDAAVATLVVGMPRLLEACHAYDLQARQVVGPARLGVLAERNTLEHVLREQLTNLLPEAFRVFRREPSTLLTILEAVRRRRGAAYAVPVTETATATPPPVAVDRSDPTGGEPDPAWLRDQDRRTAEARRPAPEPLLR